MDLYHYINKVKQREWEKPEVDDGSQNVESPEVVRMLHDGKEEDGPRDDGEPATVSAHETSTEGNTGMLDKPACHNHVEKRSNTEFALVNKARETFEEQKEKKRRWPFFKKRDRIQNYRIGLLEDQIGYYKRQVERLESGFTRLQEKVESVIGGLDGFSSASSHESLREEMDSRFSALETRFSDLEERLTALETASTVEQGSSALISQKDIVTESQLSELADDFRVEIRGIKNDIVFLLREIKGLNNESNERHTGSYEELFMSRDASGGVNSECNLDMFDSDGCDGENEYHISRLSTFCNEMQKPENASKEELENIKNLFDQVQEGFESRLSRTEKTIVKLQNSVEEHLSEALEELANKMTQNAKRLEERMDRLEQQKENSTKTVWHGVLEKM